MEMAVLEIKVSFQTLLRPEFSTWSGWHAPLPLQSEPLYDFVSQKAKLLGPANHLLKSTTERCPTDFWLKSLGVVFLTSPEVYLTEFAYGKTASALSQNVKTLVSTLHLSPGLWAVCNVWNVEREESWSLRTGGPWEVMMPWPFTPLKTHFHALLRPHTQPLPVLALSSLPWGCDLQMATAPGTALKELVVVMMWVRNSVDSGPSCLLSWRFITTESLMYLLKLIIILKTDSIL